MRTPPHQRETPARRARLGLAIFFVVLIAIDAPFFAWLYAHRADLDKYWLLINLYCWSPAIASLVARLVLREGIGDVSFRLNWHTCRTPLLIAGMVAPVICLLAYGFAWWTGLATFTPSIYESMSSVNWLTQLNCHGQYALVSVSSQMQSPVGQFVVGLLINLPILIVINAVTSDLGEELGWRGYMVTRLVDAKVPLPLLMSGVIWGLWHAPFVLAGLVDPNPNRLNGFLLFMAYIVPTGWLISWLRLRSGSLWPALLAHSSSNAAVAIFAQSTNESKAAPFGALWTGENGLLMVAVNLAAVLIIAAIFGKDWSRTPLSRSDHKM